MGAVNAFNPYFFEQGDDSVWSKTDKYLKLYFLHFFSLFHLPLLRKLEGYKGIHSRYLGSWSEDKAEDYLRLSIDEVERQGATLAKLQSRTIFLFTINIALFAAMLESHRELRDVNAWANVYLYSAFTGISIALMGLAATILHKDILDINDEVSVFDEEGLAANQEEGQHEKRDVVNYKAKLVLDGLMTLEVRQLVIHLAFVCMLLAGSYFLLARYFANLL